MNQPRLGSAYLMTPTLPRTFVPSPSLSSAKPQRLPREGKWEVVLLMDGHELNNSRGMTLENMKKTIIKRIKAAHPTERRQWDHAEKVNSLPAADYIWVARKGTRENYEERVLDFCVERKRVTDLGRCLTHDPKKYKKITIMETQMRKIRHSGITNPTILVEENGFVDESSPDIKAARTLTTEIENHLHPGFSVVKTGSVDATIDYLIEQQERLRRELPIAQAPTLDAIKTSVDNAMKCPKFQFFCRLLKISNVGDKVALAIMEGYPSEEELLEAVQQEPDISKILKSIKTRGGRSLSNKAISSIIDTFKSAAAPKHTSRTAARASAPSRNYHNQKPAAVDVPHGRGRPFCRATDDDPFVDNSRISPPWGRESAAFGLGCNRNLLPAFERALPSSNHQRTAPAFGTPENPFVLEDDTGLNRITPSRSGIRDALPSQATASKRMESSRRKRPRETDDSRWICRSCGCKTNKERDRSCTVCGRVLVLWTCTHCAFSRNMEHFITCSDCGRPCY